MKTKQEILNFLESKVGTKVSCVGNPSLDGQCVTLIKSLMEFLGVPEPYKARGNAKDCISKYISDGISKQGMGFLSVFSNKDMGAGYGHIWCNAGEGAGTFYESNGMKPLTVTKGKTYSYDNVCNFDSYISDNTYRGYDLTNQESMKVCIDQQIKVVEGQLIDKQQYESIKGQLLEVQKQNDDMSNEMGSLRAEIKALTGVVESKTQAIDLLSKEDVVQLETLKREEARADKSSDKYFNVIVTIREQLKLSSSIEDESVAESEIYSALGSLIQTNESYETQVKELESQVKKLSVYKQPVAKLTTKQMFAVILEKLLGVSNK